jgi:hypothetical protein
MDELKKKLDNILNALNTADIYMTQQGLSIPYVVAVIINNSKRDLKEIIKSMETEDS